MNRHFEFDTDLTIFFDESGKTNADKVQLMGGLSLPTKIYYSDQYRPLHQLNERYRFHWSEYKGDFKQKEGILQLFSLAMPIASFGQLNIIRYSRADIAAQEKKFRTLDIENNRNGILKNMIYTKLPERIMYGLLRGYDRTSPVRSSLFIEHANEYVSLKLAENMQLQLNIHALYRGEPFFVSDCEYRKKGEEVGIELIDILLGIIRTILENPNGESRKKREQVGLIIELLKTEKLYPFLNRLRLFELKGSNELHEIDINSSVKMFIAKHFESYSIC